MSYSKNIQQGKSSNIFINDTASVQNTQGKIRETNKSTNFIAWNVPDSESKKPTRMSQNQQSSIFTEGPIQTKPGRKYQSKDTLVLGNEDTSSFNVKREQKKEYDPNKYYKESTAYERRLRQFYGDDEKYQTKAIKSSIGVLDTELNAQDNKKFTEGNARERNFHMLYNSNGTSKHMQTTKPKAVMSKCSTEAHYTAGKDGKYNHVESLKSNIFFDEDCEKRNKEIFAVKASEPKEERETPTKNNKKKAENVFYAKMDWKDPMTSLMYRNKDNINDTAHDRKLNDLFGSKDSNSKPLRKEEQDALRRSELERNYQSEHPQEKESKIKKQMESVSNIQDNKELYDPIKLKKAERLCQNYEVTNFTHYNDVNIKKIEQMFKSKGMHIFGTKTDESYHDGKAIGKITFSIRGNNDDNAYESKMNQAKEEIKKETGLDINPSSPVKRKAA